MAKITFLIEQNNETVDCAVAEMSDEALAWSIDAVCDAYSWSEETGVTRPRFFSWMIRKWVESQVERYAMKKASEEALAIVEQIKNTVVVP
jgi:hypothetical protein